MTVSRQGSRRAALEVNLALYDNALRAYVLNRIEDVAAAIVGAASGTLTSTVDSALRAHLLP